MGCGQKRWKIQKASEAKTLATRKDKSVNQKGAQMSEPEEEKTEENEPESAEASAEAEEETTLEEGEAEVKAQEPTEELTEEAAEEEKETTEETALGEEVEEGTEEKEEEKPEKKELEEDIVEERFYTIPLRRAWIMPPKQRAPRAMRIIRSFVEKNMKIGVTKEAEEETEEEKEERLIISAELNEKVWLQGIRKPPRKIKVRVVKDSEGNVTVYPAKGD
jgi:large subunit ribosomal protein L31e